MGVAVGGTGVLVGKGVGLLVGVTTVTVTDAGSLRTKTLLAIPFAAARLAAV